MPDSDQHLGPGLGPVEPSPRSPDRFMAIPEGRGLRRHAVRGVLINASFNIGLAWIGLLHRFLIAAFLTAAEYGLWGLIVVVMMTLLYLKEVGIGDKYVQQDERDQEAAFHKAYTLEAIVTGGVLPLDARGTSAVRPALRGARASSCPGAVFALTLPLSLLLLPPDRLLPADAVRPPARSGGDRAHRRHRRHVDAWRAGRRLLEPHRRSARGRALRRGSRSRSSSPYRFRWRYDRDTAARVLELLLAAVRQPGHTIVMVQATVIAGKRASGSPVSESSRWRTPSPSSPTGST